MWDIRAPARTVLLHQATNPKAIAVASPPPPATDPRVPHPSQSHREPGPQRAPLLVVWKGGIEAANSPRAVAVPCPPPPATNPLFACSSCHPAGDLPLPLPVLCSGHPNSRHLDRSRVAHPLLVQPIPRVAHPLRSHRKGWVIRSTREPLSPHPTQTSSSRPKQQTVPSSVAQRRDPRISSLPLPFAVAVCRCRCCCCCSCLLLLPLPSSRCLCRFCF
jgi:hypothetical protein